MFPGSRVETFVAGASRVKANVLNLVQDWIALLAAFTDMPGASSPVAGVSLRAADLLFTEERVVTYGADRFLLNHEDVDWVYQDGINFTSYYSHGTPAGAVVSVYIDLPDGCRIKGVDAVIMQTTSTAGHTTLELRRCDETLGVSTAETSTQLGSTVNSAATSNRQKMSLTLVTPETMAANKRYIVRVAANAGGAAIHHFHSVSVRYDRPVSP